MEVRSRLTASGAFSRRQNFSSVRGMCRRPPHTVGEGARSTSTSNDFPMAFSIAHTMGISLRISFLALDRGGCFTGVAPPCQVSTTTLADVDEGGVP